MPRLNPRFPDPRPSRANPEHRKARKELESSHGYGWVPPVLLGLLGLSLAFDVTKDIEKHEERHRREEEDAERARRRQRRRRERERREREYGSSSRRRRSYDDAEEQEDEDRGSDDDGGGDDDDEYVDAQGRRRRIRRREEDQKQWLIPDDIDVHNDYEALGGDREAGMERAESLENGEAGDAKYDGGLDRADQLEKGEGGIDEDRAYGARPQRTIAYNGADEGRPYRRRRDDDDWGYEYVDESRGRRDLDQRRSRPRPRRQSSDW